MNMYIRIGVDEKRRERNRAAACRDRIQGVPFVLSPTSETNTLTYL